MHLGFQAHPGHTQRFLDALLAVDNVFLGQDMQNLLVRRNRHRLGRVDHPLQIQAIHFPVLDRHDAVGIEAADVTAGNTHVDRVNLAARHQLSLFHRTLYGLHRRFDVNHHAFLHTLGGVGAYAHNLYVALWPYLTDNRHHLGGTYIKAHDHLLVLPAAHGSVSPTSLVAAYNSFVWSGSLKATAMPLS